MEKFLEKAETATKLGLCIVLALFAIVSVIGTIVEPVGTVAHAVTDASFIGNKAETSFDNNFCYILSQDEKAYGQAD